MARFIFVEWLVLWLVEVTEFNFEWDDGNLNKSNDKHGVEPTETESVFSMGPVLPLGVQVSPKPKDSEERLGIVGFSNQGRLVFVSFTLRDGRIRPISSRKANKKERDLYEKGLR
jgi:uncharacterized DUF497 family protein